MIVVVSKKVKSPSVKDCDGCDTKISQESMAVALEATSKAKLPDGEIAEPPLPIVDTTKEVAPASLSKKDSSSKLESEVQAAIVVEVTT